MKKLLWSALVFCISLGVLAIGPSEQLASDSDPPPDTEPVVRAESGAGVHLTREAARRQAEVLHAALHSTLQLVHQRYYRENEGLPLPAAILSDVFAELEKEQHITLRWLAIDGQAMNADHKPRDQFEIDAARALQSGKRDYERVNEGVYRRVGAITLNSHCLKCHVPGRKSLDDRTAGLSITIPLGRE